MNDENLIEITKRSEAEQREMRRKGGRASGRKRRQIKAWKELAQSILSMPMKDGKIDKKIKSLADAKGKNISVQDAMMLAQVVKSLKGDARAFELITTLAGAYEEQAEQMPAAPSVDDTNLIIPAFDALSADIKRHLHTHYWLKGGRGSTKSSFISIKIPQLLEQNPELHAVVLRKVGNTLKNSVYQQIEWAIDALGLTDEFSFKKSPLEITLKRTGQKILFFGVDDKAKLKSLKMPFGYVGVLWYEELDQFAGMAEIRNINQSLLRGGSKCWCFYSFNPPKSRDNWVNVEQLTDRDDRLVTSSTYLQVPRDWLGEQFFLEAEALKLQRPDLYAHEYLGEVTGTGGDVFGNVEDMAMTDDMVRDFDNVRHGIDFGFAVDPFAYTKMHYDSKHHTLYVFDEVYSTGMTNKKAYDAVKDKIGDNYVYADSAEPKSIAEMCDYGLRCLPVRKGPDSRDYGIKWLSDLAHIYIDKRRAPNTYREFISYEFAQDKDGNFISQYPKANDHTIDSVRYALKEDMDGKTFSFD